MAGDSRILTAVLAGLIALVSVASAQAQRSNYSSGTTTNGLFGQNTVGGSSQPTGQSLGGTQSQSGGSSGSQSGSGSGQNTQNIALTAQTMRPAVQTSQVRGAFVGADSSDSTNARSLQGTNTRNSQFGNNGLAQLQNLFSQGMQNINQGNQTGAQVQIPVALKLGFVSQPVSPARFQSFQTRLTKLPSIHFVGPASVTLEGRTAILRGMVASTEDRELAEALALMEPDVLKVRNELTVDSGTTAEELPQAPATNSP